jgi:thiamine-phosphate pyrophosphorylase
VNSADYILFGPIFEKRVAGELLHEGIGLERLGEACRCAEEIPVLALGGVTPANAGACIAAGAAGVAGIRMFDGRSDPPGSLQTRLGD